jgi:hypothetical protein
MAPDVQAWAINPPGGLSNRQRGAESMGMISVFILYLLAVVVVAFFVSTVRDVTSRDKENIGILEALNSPSRTSWAIMITGFVLAGVGAIWLRD